MLKSASLSRLAGWRFWPSKRCLWHDIHCAGGRFDRRRAFSKGTSQDYYSNQNAEDSCSVLPANQNHHPASDDYCPVCASMALVAIAMPSLPPVLMVPAPISRVWPVERPVQVFSIQVALSFQARAPPLAKLHRYCFGRRPHQGVPAKNHRGLSFNPPDWESGIIDDWCATLAEGVGRTDTPRSFHRCLRRLNRD